MTIRQKPELLFSQKLRLFFRYKKAARIGLLQLQQAVLPRIRDDVAEEAAAYDAKFCFHGEILPFLFLH